jgi:hypothetical protein
MQDKFQRSSIAMALKGGRIEELEEWARWRAYNKEKDAREEHGQRHLYRGLPVDMGTLRRIDARQMADEPLVQKRSGWLKEREDLLDDRQETSHTWSEMNNMPPRDGRLLVPSKTRAKRKKYESR